MHIKDLLDNYNGPLLNKWDNYFDIYDYYFSSFRGKKIVFLEIGIAHGGSLNFWRQYFGEDALLIGIDVNPACKQFEGPNTRVFIGSQEDEDFLNSIKHQVPEIDILLDDGGHTMMQQITTFNCLFDHVKENGIYMCEDTHTSYIKTFGGGLFRKGTFIEFSKKHIDNLHGWFISKSARNKMINKITQSVWAVHYYNSVVVYLKKKMNEPKNLSIGRKTIEIGEYARYGVKYPFYKKFTNYIFRRNKR